MPSPVEQAELWVHLTGGADLPARVHLDVRLDPGLSTDTDIAAGWSCQAIKAGDRVVPMGVTYEIDFNCVKRPRYVGL